MTEEDAAWYRKMLEGGEERAIGHEMQAAAQRLRLRYPDWPRTRCTVCERPSVYPIHPACTA